MTEITRDENRVICENMIVKGNNLLALHTLKQQFRSKVKLIYIDPPYNTGNDSFGYNDSFNRASWLTFMKNRLDVAYQLYPMMDLSLYNSTITKFTIVKFSWMRFSGKRISETK